MAQRVALCTDCRNVEASAARALQPPFVLHPRGHWLPNGFIDYLTDTFPIQLITWNVGFHIASTTITTRCILINISLHRSIKMCRYVFCKGVLKTKTNKKPIAVRHRTHNGNYQVRHWRKRHRVIWSVSIHKYKRFLICRSHFTGVKAKAFLDKNHSHSQVSQLHLSLANSKIECGRYEKSCQHTCSKFENLNR